MDRVQDCEDQLLFLETVDTVKHPKHIATPGTPRHPTEADSHLNARTIASTSHSSQRVLEQRRERPSHRQILESSGTKAQSQADSKKSLKMKKTLGKMLAKRHFSLTKSHLAVTC